jgi:hypothetical protein
LLLLDFTFYLLFFFAGRIGRPFHLVLLPSVSSGRGPVGRYSSIRRLRSTPRPSGRDKKDEAQPKRLTRETCFRYQQHGKCFQMASNFFLPFSFLSLWNEILDLISSNLKYFKL